MRNIFVGILVMFLVLSFSITSTVFAESDLDSPKPKAEKIFIENGQYKDVESLSRCHIWLIEESSMLELAKFFENEDFNIPNLMWYRQKARDARLFHQLCLNGININYQDF
jgi:hypothetical protein